MQPKDTPRSAIFFALAAFFLWGTGDVFVKIAGAGMPVSEIIFLRGLGGLLLISAFGLVKFGKSFAATPRPFVQAGRGALFGLVTLGSSLAITNIPLVDFYVIAFITPVIVPVFGFVLLKERFRFDLFLASTAGFTAVAFGILSGYRSEGQGNYLIGIFGGLLNIICLSLYVVLTRATRKTETLMATTFYPFLANSIVGLTATLITTGIVPQVNRQTLTMLFAGMLSISGLACLNAAYQRAATYIVAPFQYTQMLWGAFYGFLVFSHIPHINTIIGGTVVVLVGLYVIWVQKKMEQTLTEKQPG